jgi:protein ImuA
MPVSKADIISQLQKEILLLQGFKPESHDNGLNTLGLIRHAFPNNTFPSAAIHEFHCTGLEDASASCGFIAAILSSLMQKSGVSIWISQTQMIFPPALKTFGINPDRIIFINLKKEKQLLWVMEEALKCDGLSAVVGDIKEISFTESRRLQLAVEQSRVTGFLLRRNPKNLATASVSRWKIKPLPGELETDMPGLGFPRWNVELMKVRNGNPGNWQMEWRSGRFRHCYKQKMVHEVLHKIAG